MNDLSNASRHFQWVTNFQDLVSTTFRGETNAICWQRQLSGDFSEIVDKLSTTQNMAQIEPEELVALRLSEGGSLAREIILNDLQLLTTHGSSPVLNLIRNYEKDASFFPTDVYSFHVDRSPVPTDTFLCTYFGESSEILANDEAEQKILVPEIRRELKKLQQGKDEDFDLFLREHFFDLHYQPKPGARPYSLGSGNLWRLAVDHPGSQVLPCIHRAPLEISGRPRLLLIC